MNLLSKPRQLIAIALSVVGIWLVSSPSAKAAPQVLTNAFLDVITLDGDISDFFLANGLPKAGVCFSNDNNGAPIIDPVTLSPVPFSEGLSGGANEPNNATVQRNQTIKHPSGFNQKRLIAAFNPTLHGGTIFVGLDLPGGFTAPDPRSVANPNYVDPPVQLPQTPFVVRGGVIRPFDADGNGESETIGRNAGAIVLRCSGNPLQDIINCSAPAASGVA